MALPGLENASLQACFRMYYFRSFHLGTGNMYFILAASLGQTVSRFPFCHWTMKVGSLFCWVFFSYETNLTGPKAVIMSVVNKASRTSFGVMLFALFRASATTYREAYASAPWYSVSSLYLARYFLK